jgi:hypothetical protein
LELVVAFTIDGADGLEFGKVTANHHKPIVASVVEIQVTCFEDKFDLTCRCIITFLVLGDETEVGFASRQVAIFIFDDVVVLGFPP